jgi:hypothetical protein
MQQQSDITALNRLISDLETKVVGQAGRSFLNPIRRVDN